MGRAIGQRLPPNEDNVDGWGISMNDGIERNRHFRAVS